MYNQTKNDILNKKLKTPIEIYDILKTKNNVKSSINGGCFDCLHLGHLDLISKTKEYSDVIIVAINSDNSIKQLKGNDRPIISELDRAFSLGALEFVDYVTIFDAPTIDYVLKTIQPTYFVKGSDYSLEKMTPSEKEIFKTYNIHPLFIDLYENYSTSNLIKIIGAD